MDLVAAEVVGILMRWMHIASMALLVGGAAFIRLIAYPTLYDAPESLELSERLAAGFRPLVYAAVAGIAGSGLFAFLARPGHTAYYYILFSAKMLLAAHIFASALLMTRPGTTDSLFYRRATGILISGIAVILISAYLRRIY